MIWKLLLAAQLGAVFGAIVMGVLIGGRDRDD